jgi:nitrogen fixation protein FixH
MTMDGTAWFANEIKGRHVLLGLVAFFGLIFFVNGIFLYCAVTTFGGGEKGSPYRSGLRYNETIAEAARDAERGWQSALAYDAKAARLALDLRDKHGQPIVGLHLAGTIGRPATDREDIPATLRELDSGVYGTEVKLAPGQWIVLLQSNELSREGDPTYRLKRRVVVQEAVP